MDDCWAEQPHPAMLRLKAHDHIEPQPEVSKKLFRFRTAWLLHLLDRGRSIDSRNSVALLRIRRNGSDAGKAHLRIELCGCAVHAGNFIQLLLTSLSALGFPLAALALLLQRQRSLGEMASTVSWQSAFWGLVPIALNSMMQPSGKVCNRPAKFGFLLRISPLMCCLDALIVLARHAVYMSSRKCLRSASRGILGLRFADGSDYSASRSRDWARRFWKANKLIIAQRFADDINNSTSEFRDWTGSPITRWVIFGLSFSQIVKLYAFRGIFWTQVCASMFLGSFLVLELLVVTPKWLMPAEEPEDDMTMNVDDRNILFSYATVAFSASFAMYLLHLVSASTLYFREGHPITSTVGGTSLTIVHCLLFLIFSGSMEKGRRQALDIETLEYLLLPLAVIALVIVNISMVVSFLKDHLAGEQPYSNSVPTLVIVLPSFFIWVPALWFWVQVYIQTSAGGDLSRYFFIMHFVAALLVYKYVYTAEGTVKPAWTDQLG